MTTARAGHTATLRQNGELLLVGGNDANGRYLASGQLYDPVAGKFTATDSMSTARSGHTPTLLQDGQVLVVGGFNGTVFVGSAELYDPATGHWTTSASIGVVSDFTAS